MASEILENCKLYVGGYDLSGDTNKITLTYGAEAKDNTVFGNTAHSYLSGLSTFDVHHEGYNNNANAQPGDTQIFNLVGAANQVVTVLKDGTNGNRGYFGQGFNSKYTPVDGAVGDVYGYQVDTQGDDNLYAGTIMLPPSPTITTTGTGSIVQLGAVSATQSVRASFHVFSVAGTGTPTLTMTVQSAALVGFGSPTNRISFTAATAVGAQLGTTAGAITDQFWRVSYTISGTSPVFGAVVVVSIQ